jgi:CBS domain containing-hemolysin-like protein
MVPRTELVAIAADLSGDRLIETIGNSGYSVFPVYRNDVDNVIGILHTIDVIKAMAAGRKTVTAAEIAREALTVPETMPADDLLTTFRRGYLMGRIGRRAHVGEAIDVEGRIMRVVAVDGLRVSRVWLSRPMKPGE